MRDIFFDLSVRSVRLNFLRSLLASIGIVIGVVAISSMGMLGTNMQLSVKDQLSANVNTVMLTSDVVKIGTGLGLLPSQAPLIRAHSTISKDLQDRTTWCRSTIRVRSLLSETRMAAAQFTDLILQTSRNSSR